MSVVDANGAAVKINFREMALDKLVETHNEMAITAHDFGLTAEPVTSFASVDEGVAACERLHTQIGKARERAAAPPKKERAKAKSAAKKAAAKAAAPSAASTAGEVVAGYTEPKTKEKDTMKKTKKAAKKIAKKAAKKSTSATRTRLPADAKITWVADGNPARKGSIFFDRVEKVRKAHGKTVETAIKDGATGADIKYLVEVKNWAKVTGGTKSAAA